MDRLRCIEVFVAVASGSSFTGAANRLSMSRGSITKHISALEHALGAQLLCRTTQHVKLTEAGTLLLAQGGRLLSEFEEIEDELKQTVTQARGGIRVGLPPAFASRHIIPMIDSYVRTYPEVVVTIQVDDGRANLIKEGLDVSLRIAPEFRDSSEISVLLARVPQVIVAAPSYLEEHGIPRTPESLAHHQCLVHLHHAPANTWKFSGPEGPVRVPVRGSLNSDHAETLRCAAVRGIGLAKHAFYVVEDDIAAGRLKIVLPEYETDQLEMRLVYTERKRLPVRIRSFVTHMKEMVPKRLALTDIRKADRWPQEWLAIPSEDETHGMAMPSLPLRPAVAEALLHLGE